MNRLVEYFRQLSIKYKLVVGVGMILLVMVLGIEVFIFRYMLDSHHKRAKDFAANLADSLSLNIRQDYAVSNLFALDRFFLGLSQEGFSGVEIQSCTLIDTEGKIIADMRPERYGQKLEIPEMAGETRAVAATTATLFEENGESHVLAIRPVFSSVNRIGTLVLSISIEAYERNFYGIVWLTIAITISFVALMGWLLIAMLHDMMIKPVLSLTRQTAKISEGEFDAPVSVDKSDELGHLGEVLETMRVNIVGLIDDLERKIGGMREANIAIGQSEEKYRILIEGSQDIIFTLDDQLRFQTVNRTIQQNLGIGQEAAIGKQLAELVYIAPEGKGLERQILEEKLQAFLSDTKPFSTKVTLQSTLHGEPVDYNLFLNHIEIERRREILGRLSLDQDDQLSPYFHGEKQKFVIGNQMTTAVEISKHLARNLNLFFERSEVAAIQLGLQEIIVNAIEHGNLGISFEAKSKVVDHEEYMVMLGERQKDARFKDRQVTIDYRLDRKQAAFRITDEGEGFDHRSVRAEKKDYVNEEMLSHGRGMTISENVFDRVLYNEKGNSVLLVKQIFVARPDKLFDRGA